MLILVPSTPPPGTKPFGTNYNTLLSCKFFCFISYYISPDFNSIEGDIIYFILLYYYQIFKIFMYYDDILGFVWSLYYVILYFIYQTSFQ